MIPGCAAPRPPPQASVVDLAPARCPEVDGSDRDEASRTTQRPPYDTRDTDGTAALSRDATRRWISAYDLSESRKNSALARLIALNERCRTPAPAKDGHAAS